MPRPWPQTQRAQWGRGVYILVFGMYSVSSSCLLISTAFIGHKRPDLHTALQMWRRPQLHWPSWPWQQGWAGLWRGEQAGIWDSGEPLPQDHLHPGRGGKIPPSSLSCKLVCTMTRTAGSHCCAHLTWALPPLLIPHTLTNHGHATGCRPKNLRDTKKETAQI